MLVLDEMQPQCRCQNCRVSRYSSRRVDSRETLIRIVVAPQHINTKKGIPKVGALTDAERNGLSVFRPHATDQEIVAAATMLVTRARMSNPKAGVFGVLYLDCAVVRAIGSSGGPVGNYCVYDTALKEAAGHAEIFQRISSVNAAEQEESRRLLFEEVRSKFEGVASFRNGLLNAYAAQT